LFQDEITQEIEVSFNRRLNMLQHIKQFFCIHAYEYEMGANQVMIKECRKCGAYHR